MKRPISLKKVYSIFFSSLLGGCATIMNGDMVEVPVSTSPPGATVHAYNKTYVTPATIELPRDAGDQIITIEKAGFQDTSVVFKESYDAWMWGSLFASSFVGVTVDLVTGDGKDLEPESVAMPLSPIRSGAPETVIKQVKPSPMTSSDSGSEPPEMVMSDPSLANMTEECLKAYTASRACEKITVPGDMFGLAVKTCKSQVKENLGGKECPIPF